MSEFHWAVVEGEGHDLAFYANLLDQGAGLADFTIVKAKQIQVEGTASGGADAVLSFASVMEEALNAIAHEDDGFSRFAAFVDSDDALYIEDRSALVSVFYTYYADVESEIILNSDVARGMSNTYSVPISVTERLVEESILENYAASCSAWIAARLAYLKCGKLNADLSTDQRFAQMPLESYLNADGNLVQSMQPRGVSAQEWNDASREALEYLEGEHPRARAMRLVKGKWLPRMLENRLRVLVGKDYPMIKGRHVGLVSACLPLIDYKNVWAENFRPQNARFAASKLMSIGGEAEA